MGSSEQPELPAWLESLRTSERPGRASNGEQPGLSATDFFDEGTFPAWMKPENSDVPDAGNSGKIPAWRPASMSAPNTDSEFLPPTGFPASSLIDEQSLPSWLQGKSVGADQPLPTNISASSLVQPDALPDWIRSMPQSQQPSGNQVPPSASKTPFPPQNNQASMNYQPPAPQPFQAHELIDQQALPPWLAGQMNSPAQPNQVGQQAEFPYNNPASAQMSGQANPPSGIGASSLLDMNSLPAWLRESEQGQGRGYAQGQEMSPLQTGQPSNNNSNNNGGNLAAASLIDMNSLPGWLRSSGEGQGPQQEAQGNVHPAPFGTTPRVENMRVPSRPRADMGPYDQSEVAANVFSSMLGVASSAPYFPSASFPSGSQQGFQGEQFPQQQGQAQMRQMPTSSPNPSSSMFQMNNAAPGMQPGFAGQGYAQAGQQGYSMGNQPGGSGQQPPAYRGSAQPYPAANAQRPNTNPAGAKPARRGIIDTIRSWFTH